MLFVWFDETNNVVFKIKFEKMKKIFAKAKICFIVSIGAFFLYASSALGDFSCSSEISYKWTHTDSDHFEAKVEKGKEGEEAKKEVKENAEFEVFFGTVQVTAATEEEAKAKLPESIKKAKTKSDSACREVHENQTKCIAIKYTANSALLQGATYDQRKALQESIKEDCARSTGRCTGSSATEGKCLELKAPEVDEKSGDKKADGKDAKDAKKGEAKKK